MPKVWRSDEQAVDQAVGRRMKMRRVLIKLSQEELGERLGITFQQVQKYEKGVNRLTAGRLYKLAEALRVPVDYFFADAPRSEMSILTGLGAEGAFNHDDDLSQATIKLMRAFVRIKSERSRSNIAKLVHEIAEVDAAGAIAENEPSPE
jgi:transcriptional regulator with XRE-family HTH domain